LGIIRVNSVAIDSFDSPNFALMATLYDPDIVMVPDIASKHGRIVQQLATHEDTLRSKSTQHCHDLERQSKRLVSVQTVRLAHMETLEKELQQFFRLRFQHFRNVDFYEHELLIAAEKQEHLKA
jgi:hypothetical protein